MVTEAEPAQLNVASCTAEQLFSGQPITGDKSVIVGHLCIPEYQRPYSWQAKQLEQLIDDLVNNFEQPQPKHQYYLGSIILHQSGNKLNIIDGQQRLTSLAILANVIGIPLSSNIQFSSPSSHRQIAINVHWLKSQLESKQLLNKLKNLIKFEQMNITLVVTASEDDAYRFFETQNTGGVRLQGADIIKAHHLRATADNVQDNYARAWEALNDLPSLLDAIMKVRYWQLLNFKDLPSHRNPKGIKQVVVSELASNCHNSDKNNLDNSNIAYRQIQLIKQTSGWSLNTNETGYAMRQPLNSGINTIDYLRYFSDLKQNLLVNKDQLPDLHGFYDFYFSQVIQDTGGTAYLKKLFDSAILLYASQFGTTRLFEAALWLFRIAYSVRVKNMKTVKEQSIPKLVSDSKLFDLIVMSYNQQQAIERFKSYSYECDNNNAEKTTKGRFIGRVEGFFGININRSDLNGCYDNTLVQAIVNKIEARHDG